MDKFKSPEKLLAFLSTQDKSFLKSPIDVEKICQIYSIEIEEVYSNEPIVGKISINENQSVSIFINLKGNSTETRKRFTIAHELGHFFLHLNQEKKLFKDSMKTMSRSESYWDPIEAQANDFAARLLMPIDLIIEEAKKLFIEDENIEETIFIMKLSNIFHVSLKAMTYRLKNLGVI